jgi:hypothetical protein
MELGLKFFLDTDKYWPDYAVPHQSADNACAFVIVHNAASQIIGYTTN